MKIKSILSILILLIFFSTLPLEAQRWEKVLSIPQPYSSNYWLDVYFLPSNPNYGWVCGFGGMVIRTTDGGNTWAGSRVNGANHLEGIHFPSVSIGYTSGQEGIFKSTDGGANWFDVSPASATTTLWGCYFMDNNNGFVIGGGCASNGGQEFWRTTDGGSNWTLFLGDLPNSGLTDLIVYSMFGLGYASSSGWIWETTDGGLTWSPWSDTGPNDWQEEITRVGNSFLVPTSTGCTGNGGGGGMRFTTDNGVSWNVRNLGVRMFGSFLLNAQTGWVAGDNRNVWYTTNGGQDWVLRNCGFDNGNLDDIWFINSNNGWIVGEGVYRLSTPLQTASKNALNFGEICLPGDSIDFVLLDNINFDADFVNVTILNDPNNEFIIESPSTNFNIGSCETIRLNIRFEPKSVGQKTANIQVNFGYGTSLNINLSGFGVAKTIAPVDTLLVINPAYCGNDNVNGLRWTAETDKESIVDISRSEGSSRIGNMTNLPLKIPNGGIETIFTANPIDTGWISTRFRCLFDPCPADTFVNVLAYGMSPIITADYSSSMTLKCLDVGFDTIPIFNTGNNDLIISDVKMLETNTGFTVSGWTDGSKIPVVIAPGSYKSVIVRYSHQTGKSNKATLQLVNNDQTYARGDKNPHHIALSAEIQSSNVFSRDTVIDFGKVCLGDTKLLNFWIFNEGDIEVTLDQAKMDTLNYTLTFYEIKYPMTLKPGDSLRGNIAFKPKRIGKFNDTLNIRFLPCDDLIQIIITGTGISIIFDTDPDFVTAILHTKIGYTKKFNVRSVGTEDFILSRIELGETTGSIKIDVSPPLPQNISYNGSMDFDVTFTCDVDTVYNGYLCFITSGVCHTGVNIPIFLQSYSSQVEFQMDTLDFGTFYCTSGWKLDTIWVRNMASYTDTIVEFDLKPDGSAFNILNKPTLPLIIDPNDSIPFYIEYEALLEGSHSATITLGTSTAPAFKKYLILKGEFYTTDTELSAKTADFGDVEQCDMQREIYIKIYNRGSVRDSLTITALSGFQNFVILPNDYLIVPAYDSTEIKVSINPPDFPVGSHNTLLQLQSNICPFIDTISSSVKIYHHYLTYTPDTIHFGEIWAEEISTKFLKIENKSSFDKKIVSMDLLPDNINFNLPANLNYPMLFKPGDTLSIPVTFSSATEGDYLTSVRILEESVCRDSAFVYLTAKVPEEIYQSTVQIGNYKAKPGQKITMIMNLSTAMPKLRQSGINIQISFDPYLFYPTAMFVQNSNNNGITIPFTYRSGLLNTTIEQKYAELMMQNAGDILWIQGTVFLSNPTETPVLIEQFEPITNKQVILTKLDGSLELYDVCLPLADFKLKFINQPLLTVTQNPVTNGNLNLSIQNLDLYESDDIKESSLLNLKIFTIEGMEIYNSDINYNSERVDISIDVSRYTSGMYYIMLSNFGYIYNARFIIIN